MPFSHRAPYVDPRLGSYFGIFISIFVSAFVLLLMFEQLGTSDRLIRLAVLAAPIALFAAIGLASYTSEVPAFFAARRRVPAVYNGLVLALAATGSVGIAAFPGLILINGIDAWCYLIGLVAGFVMMAVLIAPYLRKFGAYTLPGYLARRFESRSVRLIAAGVFGVPMVVMLVAEFSMSARIAALLTGQSTQVSTIVLSSAVIACVLAGGMRGLSWTASAQAMATLIAVCVPAAMVGVLLTRLPVAALSYGPVIRGLGNMEHVEGIKIVATAPLAFDLAGDTLTPLLRRISEPFGSVGTWSFSLAGLVIAAGTAGAPWLLPRSGTTPSVYFARKSHGWAILALGVLLVTLSATAVFMRDYIMSEVVGRSSDAIPGWFRELAAQGLLHLDGESTRLKLANVSVLRDGVIYGMPIAAGMPAVIGYLGLAGVLAAGLAALSSTTVALAAILSEDVIGGLRWDPLPPVLRLRVARGAIVAVTVIGAWFALIVPTDPFLLVLWAASLSAATAFPVVVLSIWWKRVNAAGTAAGMIAGFVITVLAIAAGGSGWLGLPGVLAGAVGAPIALVIAVGVSLLTPPPGRGALEAVRDMRIPGGEAIFDRETRLSRLKQR